MTRSIRVEVTAEQIAIAGDDRRDWAAPMEVALAALTGEQVSIDGSEEITNVATISQGVWTLVVDLPAEANVWLERRWGGDADDRMLGSEPFAFDLEVPDWIEAFLAKAVSA